MSIKSLKNNEDKYTDWHMHKNMNKAELVEVEFYADTTPQFLSDVYYTGETHPLLRVEQHERGVRKAPLKVTLLELSCDVRQYGKHKNSTGIDVYSMIVSDYTFGVFKLVLNSGLSQDFPQEDIHPGCTIILHDWSVLWNKATDEGIKRGIVFINHFDFEPAPHSGSSKEKDDADSESVVTPDYSRAWIDMKAIEKVKKESVMIFLDSFQHEEGFFYWVQMSNACFRRGEFIDNIPDRAVYQSSYLKRKAPEWGEMDCACKLAPHCFEECITVLHPLCDVDMDSLYDQVVEKLKGRISAETFGELHDSHQRWCFYWYYSINFFHFGGEDSQELPDCFVKAVRMRFPSLKGNYTGYRTTQDRRSSLEES